MDKYIVIVEPPEYFETNALFGKKRIVKRRNKGEVFYASIVRKEIDGDILVKLYNEEKNPLRRRKDEEELIAVEQGWMVKDGKEYAKLFSEKEKDKEVSQIEKWAIDVDKFLREKYGYSGISPLEKE